MGLLSPWEDVSRTFMILLRPWTLTQGEVYRVYDMDLCSGLSSAFLSLDIIILCLARITMVQYVTYIHELCYEPLTLISELYFHHEFESNKMSFFWHRHTKFWHMGVSPWVKCYSHSWPLYDLNLWPICGWPGVSLVSFTHSFNLVLNLVFFYKLVTS